jgi:hypothetical protein
MTAHVAEPDGVLALLETHLAQLARLADEEPGAGSQVEAIRRGESLAPGFEADDLRASRIYAGLAVLTRDAHLRLGQEAPVLEELVRDVEAQELRRYTTAFPTYSGLPVEDLPQGLTNAALAGEPVVPLLSVAPIVHEWTVFPGFAVWRRFWRGDPDAPEAWARLRRVVCARWHTPSASSAADLPGKVAAAALSALLVGSAVPPAALAPVAAYLAFLVVRRGRARLCNEDPTAAVTTSHEELEDLDRKLFRAEARLDIEGTGWRHFLEETLAEDFVLRRSKPGSPPETRPEVIARIEASANPKERVPVPRDVWSDGNLGVVRTGGLLDEKWFANIKVFRRDAGDWRCVYWQVTQETPEARARPGQ